MAGASNVRAGGEATSTVGGKPIPGGGAKAAPLSPDQFAGYVPTLRPQAVPDDLADATTAYPCTVVPKVYCREVKVGEVLSVHWSAGWRGAVGSLDLVFVIN